MGLLRRDGSDPSWTAVLFPLVVGLICVVAAIVFLAQGEPLIAVVLAVFAVGDAMLVSGDVRFLIAERRGTAGDPPEPPTLT